MTRINNNLIFFLGIILIAGIFLLISSQKLFSFVSHTTYYCQSLISSLSLSIPFYISALPFFLVFMLLSITLGKLSIILLKVHFLKRKLIKNNKSDTQFNLLLSKLDLTESTYLIDSNERFAFCLGIRGPKIYISSQLVNLLTLEEIEVVLKHEQYHLQNRDTLIMLIASIAQSLVPFFPVISDILYSYRIRREIMADKQAIEQNGNPKPLLSALRKILQTEQIVPTYASAIADHDTLEPRIKALVQNNKYVHKINTKKIFISLGSIAVIIALFVAPINVVEFHHDHLDIMSLSPMGDACTSVVPES